jgi:hypothetical protein
LEWRETIIKYPTSDGKLFYNLDFIPNSLRIRCLTGVNERLGRKVVFEYLKSKLIGTRSEGRGGGLLKELPTLNICRTIIKIDQKHYDLPLFKEAD